MHPGLISQRQHLKTQLTQAFSDTVLGQGTSISEADVIDSYGSDLQRQQARAADFQGPWQDFPRENVKPYTSVFTFMDDAGFAYHLAAYLWLALQEDPSQGLCEVGWLTFEVLEAASWVGRTPALNKAQLQVVLAYLQHVELLEADRLQTDTLLQEDLFQVQVHWNNLLQQAL